MPVIRVSEFSGKPRRSSYQQDWVLEPHYRIMGIPSFEDVEFTEGSNENLSWPNAVRFAADQYAVLQSAREAAAFRIEANGLNGANHYQATRTFVAYFNDGNSFYAAIDDAPSKENVVLAHALEAFDSYLQTRSHFLLPMKDLKGMLKCAEKSGRVVPVPDKSLLKLSTEQVDGTSAFGHNVWNQAIFVDTAELYAGMLYRRGYHNGYVSTFTPQTLEQIGVSNKRAEVRPLSLCDINFSVECVHAYGHFSGHSRARGVRNARFMQ
ncbi:hypothetical protein HZB03_04455 [Candidatus Woesearchaeota archaeon]|nr:hypothetical protein [Candidatus Woesearchaeota archaeon]